ncbi:MAG: adenylate/guanylate cyclase domain-containing protein [Nitrososphaera sp.]
MLSPTRDMDAIQARVRQTLDKGVQIDLSTDQCKRFLMRRVNQKIAVAILYVDLDGSTKLSMSIEPNKFATILHVFSQEMSLLISEYGGYILKFVGDAVIGLFPAEYDSRQAVKNAMDCAKGMREVIKKCINPELKTHGLPEIKAKISADQGDVQVVLYGKSLERSHIDIVGLSISMAAKMLPLAKTWEIVVGQSVYEKLADREGFDEIKVDHARWTFFDERNGISYKIYSLR